MVLTGIHLGAFGLDLSPRRTLLDLLEVIEAEAIVPRLRLGSLEPGELTDDLIDFLARSRTVCPHLHIPLQSGDDAVLARMNRRYTTGFFRERIIRLSEAVPDIFIGMDVIAGFPGETDAEFARTVSFLEGLPVAALHVFPFSPRPGTPAAELPNRVPGPVAKERVRTLLRLSERKREAFHRRFVGRELEALLLHPRERRSRGGAHPELYPGHRFGSGRTDHGERDHGPPGSGRRGSLPRDIYESGGGGACRFSIMICHSKQST